MRTVRCSGRLPMRWGVCPEGGVSAYDRLSGGVSAQGGVHLPLVDRQTPVKT